MENVDLIFEDSALRAVAKKRLNVIRVRVVYVLLWKTYCLKLCMIYQVVQMLEQSLLMKQSLMVKQNLFIRLNANPKEAATHESVKQGRFKGY